MKLKNDIYFLKTISIVLVLALLSSCIRDEPRVDTLTVNAGPNAEGKIGRTVTLNASGTVDTEGNTISYSWEMTTRPSGSSATLLNASTSSPSFTPDLIGTYTATLIASTDFESGSDQVSINVVSTLNVNAGSNLSGMVGDEVQLNGSGTNDTDSQGITYRWEFAATPEGSTANLVNANTANPRFTPDVEGIYRAVLTASTEFEEKTDEVIIDVEPRVTTIMITSNITTNTTWEKVNPEPGQADYRILNNITVSAVLTVEPGVIIELEEGVVVNINNNGRLNAVGTESERIVFTGVEKTNGYWGELFFQNSIGLQNRFEYVTFEYGGGGASTQGDPYALVYLESSTSSNGSTASFVNCIFKESGGYGLGTATTNNTDINDFSNNQFINNQGEAITTSLRIARKIDQGSTFTGNGLDGARLRRNTLEVAASLPALDYIISDNDLLVRERLTIAPGAKFSIEEGLNITIDGSGIFVAIGTEENPIIFEGSQNTPGYWGGILFTNSRSVDNRLSFVRISDGGNRLHSDFRFNLAVGGNFSNDFSEARIDNCTFTNSSGYGLTTRRNGTTLPSFANNTFNNNEDGAIQLSTIEHLKFIDDNSDLGESNPLILVSGGVSTTNGTWKKLKGNGYVVIGSNTNIESKITIEPGAEFKFNENVLLNIRNAGTMKAEGTAELPITFTSNRQDDIVFWNGIFFNNTNSVDNVMTHCIVENAGRNQAHASTGKSIISVGGAFSNDVSSAVIRDCTIRNSDGHGISVRNNSSINDDAATSNTFANIADNNVNLP